MLNSKECKKSIRTMIECAKSFRLMGDRVSAAACLNEVEYWVEHCRFVAMYEQTMLNRYGDADLDECFDIIDDCFEPVEDGHYIVYRLTRLADKIYGVVFAYTRDFLTADFMFRCAADRAPDDDLFITQTERTLEAFKWHPSFKEVIWL